MSSEKNQKLKQIEMEKISEDWEVNILDEFIEWITYGFTCPMPSTDSGPYMITAKDLEGNKINYDTARKTSEEAFKEKLTDKSKPKENDILLSKDGTLGRVAIVGNERICINQSIALLRPNNKILSKFLYYLLISPNYQKKMELDSDGTVIKHIYITRVNKMKVAIPNILEQTNIAKILSDLDMKIELNQQMNKTLEAIGHAIFKHWFVDFEFPNEKGKPYKSSGEEMIDSELGKIPKDWEIKPIDEIADFLNGLASQRYPPENEDEFLPVIKIRELRQGITDSSDKASVNIPNKYIVEDGDVLFSWSGSLEIVVWTYGKGALNQHLFKVTSEKYPKWFYYYWIKQHLPEYRRIAEGKATTMGHIQRHHLKNSLVLTPDSQTLLRLNKILSPIFEKIIIVNIENRNLSQIRDSLLPKLMSGQIRVKIKVSK